MKNLNDLNVHLFDVIERLKDGNDPDCDIKDSISVERAKAINDISKTIVAGAKVQAEVVKALVNNTGVDAENISSMFFGDDTKLLK